MYLRPLTNEITMAIDFSAGEFQPTLTVRCRAGSITLQVQTLMLTYKQLGRM